MANEAYKWIKTHSYRVHDDFETKLEFCFRRYLAFLQAQIYHHGLDIVAICTILPIERAVLEWSILFF